MDKSAYEKTEANTGRSVIKIWAVIVWLVIWEIAARLIGQEILLVSPVAVLCRFFELAVTKDFWLAVLFSFSRITGGFFLALFVGTVLAGVSSESQRVKELLAPLMAVIKATPVASFIILILIWVSSRNLSVIISFLMVLPVIYSNVLQGIESTDRQLLEMAQIFRVSFMKKICYIYAWEVIPFFQTACSISLGLCWKAGIAAEVIGIPDGSVGEHLYEAKVYLETPDLFAWTLTIIALSVCFEKIFLLVMNKGLRLIRKAG